MKLLKYKGVKTSVLLILVAIVLGAGYSACSSQKTAQLQLPVVKIDPNQADSISKAIRAQVSAEVAEGLELTLWASDSLAPDPIALVVDDLGRVYITRTNRQKNSEFDIRGHRDWMTEAISLRTVEDRRAFLKKTFAPEKSEENSWLADLNHDSIHDWRDLAVEKEQVFRLEDVSGDGIADVAQVILEDFNEEITDVAGALLVHEGNVYVGVGPDMWRLEDRNGDGILDHKESLAHGFNVHIGFSGHGMSGLTVGPDGRIYWGAGDIGMSLTDKDGKLWDYPNQGVIVRCNPDGSDFEVFAAGLRNTHEFTFDEYGNMFSVDNDGDHRGESERLVYIVQGHDAGWRTNWQFGKYTDPNNNGYKVWMDEKLYVPRWEGQAAYIIPPIRNYHNGPTGLKYNPGMALGPDWVNKFFFVEFTGTPARSHVWAFKVKPDGAGFGFDSEEKVLSGILPTGMDFGPDGAMYLGDWIDGWGTKDYGRVWKLDVPSQAKTPERQEIKSLMAKNFDKFSDKELAEYLRHADMRIRRKAQFALARQGKKGATVFEEAFTQKEHQLARVHGIWGMGQLIRKNQADAASLLPLLNDKDDEIRSQAARQMGDVRYGEAGDALAGLLKDPSSRVKFYAAEALGRIAYEPAVQPLLDMVEANGDADLYVRHAAALALSRIGKSEPLIALADSPSRSLRIAAILALRRMRHEGVAAFVNDQDEYVATEAARAIHDDWSIEGALPTLAEVLNTTSFTGEPFVRRAINANFRLGNAENLNNLVAYSTNNQNPSALRAEAISALGTWGNPSVLDRVDGRNRGLTSREIAPVLAAMKPIIPSLLKDSRVDIRIAGIDAVGKLKMADFEDQLFAAVKSDRDEAVRETALRSLFYMGADKSSLAMETGLKDKSSQVRSAALDLIPQLEATDTEKVSLLSLAIKNGSQREKQSALEALGKLSPEASAPLLGELLTDLKKGSLASAIRLDLIEAIENTDNQELNQKLDEYQQSKEGMPLVDQFAEVLEGGQSWQGRRILTGHEAGQCMRCHALGEGGATVGPNLANIGNELTRKQILEALVDPSARLAPGYGIVSLTLNDGNKTSGVLLEENSNYLTIKTSDAEPVKVPKNKISQRVNAPSAMPPMGSILSKRELRDLIEYLSTLKRAPQAASEGHGEV